MRILIAEDQRDLNQLLKKRLKEAGYSVDACFDGAAVFDYLLGAEYDALVLDIMMPKVDGIQVVRRLRREGNQDVYKRQWQIHKRNKLDAAKRKALPRKLSRAAGNSRRLFLHPKGGPCNMEQHFYLLTGVMASGKSATAQALAERLPRCVHLRGDVFRKMIVTGREEMTSQPTPQALEQLLSLIHIWTPTGRRPPCARRRTRCCWTTRTLPSSSLWSGWWAWCGSGCKGLGKRCGKNGLQ